MTGRNVIENYWCRLHPGTVLHPGTALHPRSVYALYFDVVYICNCVVHISPASVAELLTSWSQNHSPLITVGSNLHLCSNVTC